MNVASMTWFLHSVHRDECPTCDLHVHVWPKWQHTGDTAHLISASLTAQVVQLFIYSTLKYSGNTKEAIFSLRIYIIFGNTACARVTKANKMAVSRHVVNATNWLDRRRFLSRSFVQRNTHIATKMFSLKFDISTQRHRVDCRAYRMPVVATLTWCLLLAIA